MIDLMRYVPENARGRLADAGRFYLSTNYSLHMTLMQHPPEPLIMWLAGFYLAEGAKRRSKAIDDPNDWSLAQKNPHTLAAVVRALKQLGVEEDRMVLDVRHGSSIDGVQAKRVYAQLDIKIIGVRAANPQRASGKPIELTHSATLRVLSSRAFGRLFVKIINDLVQGDLIDRISIEGARAFAFGYLDGDGQATNMRTSMRLGATDQDGRNLLALDRALTRVYTFDNEPIFEKNNLFRYVNGRLTARLALDGAFRFSMARARLIYFAIKYAPYSHWADLEPELLALRRYVPEETMGIVNEGSAPYPLLDDPSISVPFVAGI